MTELNEVTTVFEGRHLSMVSRGHWEFVTRNTRRPVVGIVAITDAGYVVLVEQHRPPIGQRVIEIPAGLTGDIHGSEEEASLEAAKRELLEETGYDAAEWTELVAGYSSPGITDEQVILFMAQGLTKRNAGGGDDGEQITIHEVPLSDVARWLTANGMAADLKLFAGLYLAQVHLQQNFESR